MSDAYALHVETRKVPGLVRVGVIRLADWYEVAHLNIAVEALREILRDVAEIAGDPAVEDAALLLADRMGDV